MYLYTITMFCEYTRTNYRQSVLFLFFVLGRGNTMMMFYVYVHLLLFTFKILCKTFIHERLLRFCCRLPPLMVTLYSSFGAFILSSTYLSLSVKMFSCLQISFSSEENLTASVNIIHLENFSC